MLPRLYFSYLPPGGQVHPPLLPVGLRADQGRLPGGQVRPHSLPPAEPGGRAAQDEGEPVGGAAQGGQAGAHARREGEGKEGRGRTGGSGKSSPDA